MTDRHKAPATKALRIKSVVAKLPSFFRHSASDWFYFDGLGLQFLEQLGERGIRQDTVKLRPKIVDQADVFDDDVLHFPIIACGSKFVVN